MCARPARSLPGVRFEAPSTPEGTLPRMDVAAFVGLASRGPLHTPTLVESAEQCASVFGPDLALAWDPSRGEEVTANLGPSVRAFFRNGGRRCWVVSVGGPEFVERGFDVSVFLDAEAEAQPTAHALALLLDQRAAEQRVSRGLHALWTIEEVTLIAVPDASHRSWWDASEAPDLAVEVGANTTTPTPAVVTEHRQGCACCGGILWRPPPRCPDSPPPAGAFRESSAVPALRSFSAVRTGEVIRLSWEPVPARTSRPESAPVYTVEEFSRPDASDARVIFAGRSLPEETGLRVLRVRGRPPGVWRYRVRVTLDGVAGSWSDARSVQVPRAMRRELDAPRDDHPGLLRVQRELLKLCVARGDLVAVLSLPEHFREREAIAYAQRLRGEDAHDRVGFVPESLSYAMLAHPWLGVSETLQGDRVRPRPEDDDLAASPLSPLEDDLQGVFSSRPRAFVRWLPPDGALCGVMASLARDRGAWISPAEKVLADVVALRPEVRPDQHRSLLREGVDVVRQQARGCSLMEADTLTDDPDLLPVNVRRLLTFLRRVALQRGMTYAFEPHDATLRREVKGAFDALLGDLFGRGAFAGRDAASAFQVTVDVSNNPAVAVEQGRLLIELKVAPALPLRFLRIRLVQRGGQIAVTEGGA